MFHSLHFRFCRGAAKRPVGILKVKIVHARKLLNKDIWGASDPYVQLSLSGEKLPFQKTSVIMNNLNPEWNEDFKLTVNDPQSQVLQLHVFDCDKVFVLFLITRVKTRVSDSRSKTNAPFRLKVYISWIFRLV